MIKNYMLDTNILLENPMNIYGFEDNNVYLCGTTLQELDAKKSAPGELGFNARESCRILDGLRNTGDLVKGVSLPNGGTLIIEPDGVDQSNLPEGFSISVPDNRIISSCIHLNKTALREPDTIILLTNDISMRVNASICGIRVQGVRNDVVEDKGYTGHTEISATAVMIKKLKEAGEVDYPASKTPGNMLENEFVTLSSKKDTVTGIYQGGKIKMIRPQTLYGGVTARNKYQMFAMRALMDPDIPLVILEGPAGTAKTFLSLAAGLSQADFGYGKQMGIYNRILISRPNSGSSDPGFGFLPGDLEDKMAPLLANYYDNLESLIRGEGDNKEDYAQIKMQIDDLFETNVIEVCPLSYIRGRSLYNSYIICDEAQNASKKLIRDVVTRAGEGTKVVLCGDVRQIDVPTLDSRNNGILYSLESMKGNPLTAIVRMSEEECVRSALSEAALKLMR